MKNRPKITDVMTADPVTVHTSQKLSEVYDLIQAGSLHHIPVVDGLTPVGMISSTDILKLVYDIDSGDDRMLRTLLDHQFTIADAMSPDVVAVPVSENLREVVDPLSSGAQHSVVVVNDTGDLVGIVTTTDLVQLLGDLL